MTASVSVSSVKPAGHDHAVVPGSFSVLRTGEVFAFPYCRECGRSVLQYYPSEEHMRSDLGRDS